MTIEQTDTVATILFQFEVGGGVVEEPVFASYTLSGASGNGHIWGSDTYVTATTMLSADVGPGGRDMKGLLLSGYGDSSTVIRFSVVRKLP